MPLPLPASTVAIICDGEKGIEVLMVRRHQNLANAPGAWAFPGGRVEEEDYADTADHFLAAQCAAVRETIEETGLCIEKEGLIPFAHWTTPTGPQRRYATWFFLTEVSGPLRVQVDGNEIVDHCWLTTTEILRRHQQGKMEITPPGFVTLSRLQNYSSSPAATAAFAQQQLVHYNPRLLAIDNGRIVFYEGDSGYENRDPNVKGHRNRITIIGNEWHYENSFVSD